MNDYFVFDNKPSTDFGCYVVPENIHQSPGRDYKKVSVPGRSGDLLIDNERYANTYISYYAFFYCDNVEENLRDLKSYLLSKKGY